MRLYHPLIDAWTPGNGAEMISVENPATEETGASVTCAIAATWNQPSNEHGLAWKCGDERRQAVDPRPSGVQPHSWSRRSTHTPAPSRKRPESARRVARRRWSRAIETLRWSAENVGTRRRSGSVRRLPT